MLLRLKLLMFTFRLATLMLPRLQSQLPQMACPTAILAPNTTPVVSVLQPGFETSGWAYSGSQL